MNVATEVLHDYDKGYVAINIVIDVLMQCIESTQPKLYNDLQKYIEVLPDEDILDILREAIKEEND